MGQGTLGVIKMSRYRETMSEALRKVYETPEGFALVSKAKEIAKKFKNNMSKAVAEIEKLKKVYLIIRLLGTLYKKLMKN